MYEMNPKEKLILKALVNNPFVDEEGFLYDDRALIDSIELETNLTRAILLNVVYKSGVFFKDTSKVIVYRPQGALIRDSKIIFEEYRKARNLLLYMVECPQDFNGAREEILNYDTFSHWCIHYGIASCTRDSFTAYLRNYRKLYFRYFEV